MGSRGEAPRSSGVLYNKLSSDEHAFKPYLVTLVGRELVWGPGGRAPGSSGVLGNKLLSDEHAFIPYLVTLVGRELAWGPEAEPPEVQGFWAINNCQMSMLLYLIW